VLPEPVKILKPGELTRALDAFIKLMALHQITATPIGVIIDHLTANFGPGSTNDDGLMREFCDTLTAEIIRVFGDDVFKLVLHHYGKSGRGRGGRGSQVVTDHAGTVWQMDDGVPPPPAPISFTVKHDRDGPSGQKYTLDLEEVDLEPDKNGKERSSLTITNWKVSIIGGSRHRDLSNEAAEALRCIANLINQLSRRAPFGNRNYPTGGANICTVDEAFEHLKKAGNLRGKRPDDIFKSRLNVLKRAGRIAEWDNTLWVVNPAGDAAA
jgi:hypothetical protein